MNLYLLQVSAYLITPFNFNISGLDVSLSIQFQVSNLRIIKFAILHFTMKSKYEILTLQFLFILKYSSSLSVLVHLSPVYMYFPSILVHLSLVCTFYPPSSSISNMYFLSSQFICLQYVLSILPVHLSPTCTFYPPSSSVSNMYFLSSQFICLQYVLSILLVHLSPICTFYPPSTFSSSSPTLSFSSIYFLSSQYIFLQHVLSIRPALSLILKCAFFILLVHLSPVCTFYPSQFIILLFQFLFLQNVTAILFQLIFLQYDFLSVLIHLSPKSTFYSSQFNFLLHVLFIHTPVCTFHPSQRMFLQYVLLFLQYVIILSQH